jgi:hypothetical protein
MACIDPKDIPQSLLPAGASRKKETDAIGTLDAYSFIIRRPADLALDLHRLVHLATRNWLRKEGLITQWTKRAISRLEEVFPDHGHKNRSLWRTYLPHSRYVLLSDLVDKNEEIRMNLTWRFGMCLYSDGRYNEAEVSFMEVAERRKKVLGAEHPIDLDGVKTLSPKSSGTPYSGCESYVNGCDNAYYAADDVQTKSTTENAHVCTLGNPTSIPKLKGRRHARHFITGPCAQ